MADTNAFPTWQGWETVRKLGKGTFGSVYEIQRDLFGKTEKAALKVITIPQSEGDVEDLYSVGYDRQSVTEQFKSYLADIVREYSLMAEMKGHTNIVYCDDIRYIQHDDGIGWDIFIKMELLTPLLKVLDKNPGEGNAIRLGMDICRALVLCKEKNIIHRDIKPQNIFVSETGDYKLGDFGIAKTVEGTMGGTKTGTYIYMAPEVYNNQPYGSAADIYSLGLVLYWMLNERRLPFMPLPPAIPKASDSSNAQMRRFSGEAIPAPKNGSAELKRIVLKACEYDVNNRYHTAEEMLRDLEALGGVRTTYKANDESAEDDGTTGAWRPAGKTAAAFNDSTAATVGAWSEKKTMSSAKSASFDDDGEKTVGAWSKRETTSSAKETSFNDDGEKTVGMWSEKVSHGTAKKPPVKPKTTANVKKTQENPIPPPQTPARPAPVKKKRTPKKKLIIIAAAVAAIAIIVIAYPYLAADRDYYDDGTLARVITRGLGNTPIKETVYKPDGSLDNITEFSLGCPVERKWYAPGGYSGKYVYCVEEFNHQFYLVTKKTYYRSDETVDGYYEYEYDRNDKKTKEAVYEGDGSLSYMDEFEYYDDGKMKKHTSYLSDGFINFIEEFDETGLIFRSSHYYSDEVIVNEFDSNHNMIRSTYTYADGSENCEEFVYDESGNLVRKDRFDGEGTPEYYVIYEYDHNGNLIHETQFSADGDVISRTEYEYDTNGNKIKCLYSDGDNCITHWTEYEYDSSNREIKFTAYNGDGSVANVMTTEYDGDYPKITNYDSDGNIVS